MLDRQADVPDEVPHEHKTCALTHTLTHSLTHLKAVGVASLLPLALMTRCCGCAAVAMVLPGAAAALEMRGRGCGGDFSPLAGSLRRDRKPFAETDGRQRLASHSSFWFPQ